MPLYDGSKGPPGALYPTNATDSEFQRLEPLITPTLLKSRFLKGISMTLKVKDLETGKPFRITDEELADYIESAVCDAEDDTGICIMPTKFSDKLPYQRQDYEKMGYLQLPHKPISSIDSMTVKMSDGVPIFEFPMAWLETANLVAGQLNLIPLASGLISADASSSGSALFFTSLWNMPWVAALFAVEYTTGFKDGLVPRSVNNLIGTIAAMRVLSQLAAAQSGQNSVSIGLNGMNQSVSGPGPDRYKTRMGELAEDRKRATKKIRKIFGTSFVTSTV